MKKFAGSNIKAKEGFPPKGGSNKISKSYEFGGSKMKFTIFLGAKSIMDFWSMGLQLTA